MAPSDIIALCALAVSIVTGIPALILGIQAHRRDRANVSVRLAWDMTPMGGGRLYDPDKRYLSISIANTGRRPVTITGALIVYDRTEPRGPGGVIQQTAQATTLAEGETFPRPILLDQRQIAEEVRARGLHWRGIAVMVEDSTGREYWSDEPARDARTPSWWTS